MGAYGRSRLREFLFGGFTQHILKGVDLPVFAAH
jgi:nucleotide-binding universal stress UspA family protein